MSQFLNAVRAFFEEKNKTWLSHDVKHLVKTSRTDNQADLWRQFEDTLEAQHRAMLYRKSRVLRAHTRVNVRKVDTTEDGDIANACIDELVTWVYRDGLDYGIESRIFHHWQQWENTSRGWCLVQAVSSGDRPLEQYRSDTTKQRTDPDIELMPMLRKECRTYSRLQALRYAELWWNGNNPTYTSLDDDCTNFISQSLFAGNIPMVGGQDRASGWWYKFAQRAGEDNWSFSWTTSNALYVYLTQHVRAERLTSARKLMIGDLVFYDWQGNGKFHHTTVVVDFDNRGDPLVNAHTDASYHRHYLYLDSRAWTPKTKYAFIHLPDEVC